MSKEMLHGLIDMIPDSDAETVYNVLLKFIQDDRPENDELRAIAKANTSIEQNGTTPHNLVNWN